MTGHKKAVNAHSSTANRNSEMVTHNLPVLKFLMNAQMQHGLLHKDFERYRRYCNRRLLRIRKSIHQINSKGRKFQKATLPISGHSINDERYLQIPLICADRAWAYAQQLLSEQDKNKRSRHHFMRRMRKAIYYCDMMEKLMSSGKSNENIHDSDTSNDQDMSTNDPTENDIDESMSDNSTEMVEEDDDDDDDEIPEITKREIKKIQFGDRYSARTKLEIRAYSLWMHAFYAFYREDWAKSKNHFHNSLIIYQNLRESFVHVDNERELYDQKLKDIRIYMRYCQYKETGDQESIDVLKEQKSEELSQQNALANETMVVINQLLVEAKEDQKKTTDQFNWFSIILMISNEKQRQWLRQRNMLEEDLQLNVEDDSRQYLNLIDKHLVSLTEISQYIRDDLRKEKMSDQMEDLYRLSPNEMKPKLLFLLCLMQNRLILQSRKNIFLIRNYEEENKEILSVKIGKLKYKSQIFVNLFDKIIQGSMELLKVNNSNEDIQFFSQMMEIRLNLSRIRRIYYIALFYFYGDNFERCLSLVEYGSNKLEKFVKLNSIENLLPIVKKYLEISVDLKFHFLTFIRCELDEILQANTSVRQIRLDFQHLTAMVRTSKFTQRTTKLLEMSANREQFDNEFTKKYFEEKSNKELEHRMNVWCDCSTFKNLNQMSVTVNQIMNDDKLKIEELLPNILDVNLEMEPLPALPTFYDLAQGHIEMPNLQDKIKSKDTSYASNVGDLVKRFLWFGK
ncbi:hypothetical protein SNEBB_008981 [Seison nebaliae]|nr:hypothetical protein SNEBB_008981 [Seison nebaliae]